MHRPAFVLIPLLVTVLLIAAGCGDDSEKPSATATPGPLTTTVPAATGTPSGGATPEETEQPFSGAQDPVEGPGTATGFGVLTDVRTGEHAGYDRIAFEFEGDVLPTYRVEYVTSASGCGSGEPVTVGGTAILRVKFTGANTHDEAGATTIDATELSPGLTSIVEAKQTCDFEADVTWVVGVTEQVDFRVIELADPPRLAIDVAHP